jgi:hypothetical protein
LLLPVKTEALQLEEGGWRPWVNRVCSCHWWRTVLPLLAT